MINQDILNVVVQEIKSTPADELERRLQQSEQSAFAQSINELSAFSSSTPTAKKPKRLALRTFSVYRAEALNRRNRVKHRLSFSR